MPEDQDGKNGKAPGDSDSGQAKQGPVEDLFADYPKLDDPLWPGEEHISSEGDRIDPAEESENEVTAPLDQDPAPPAEAKPKPEPEPAPEAEDESSDSSNSGDSIKVVTDDDLRKLFEMSSPGFKPPATAATPPEEDGAPEQQPETSAEPGQDDVGESTEEISVMKEADETTQPPVETGGDVREEAEPPQPEPDPPDEESSQEIEEIKADDTPPEPEPDEPTGEIEEIGLDEGSSPAADEDEAEPSPSEPAADESDAAPEVAPPDESSTDELVEKIEQNAEVGAFHAVAAGKKGQLLEQTEKLMEQLEPVGDDFMSTDELRKLFNNVNLLMDISRENSERIARLEQLFEELMKKLGED